MAQVIFLFAATVADCFQHNVVCDRTPALVARHHAKADIIKRNSLLILADASPRHPIMGTRIDARRLTADRYGNR